MNLNNNVIKEHLEKGFYIKKVTRKQWNKWADKIQQVTGLTWMGGDALCTHLYSSLDIGYLPADKGITSTWIKENIAEVPFHYKTLKEFRKAIWLVDKYKELRNNGFVIDGVTLEDLKCGVFNTLNVTWACGEDIFTTRASQFHLYLNNNLLFYSIVAFDLIPTGAYHFNSFKEFLEYLDWKEENKND